MQNKLRKTFICKLYFELNPRCLNVYCFRAVFAHLVLHNKQRLNFCFALILFAVQTALVYIFANTFKQFVPNNNAYTFTKTPAFCVNKNGENTHTRQLRLLV
jgi:hypothetical protein